MDLFSTMCLLYARFFYSTSGAAAGTAGAAGGGATSKYGCAVTAAFELSCLPCPTHAYETMLMSPNVVYVTPQPNVKCWVYKNCHPSPVASEPRKIMKRPRPNREVMNPNRLWINSTW